MRDPHRLPTMLVALLVLWRQYPDMRLGQLVANLARMNGEEPGFVFLIEDDEMLDRIRKGFGHD